MQTNSKGQKEKSKAKLILFLGFWFLKTNLQMKNSQRQKGKTKANKKQSVGTNQHECLKLSELKYNLITIYSNNTATS